ncbi:hypothetical protein K461DRAFT_263943 [Myriangium duriaei CBS 260.36]|uniref:DUF7593 domain-containing protein n=1 Tax=Myriangium duriaei CBS 260.36 TaxID=1168546 RepID=A0A9P4JC84_9PEZI|nr:hypothetical protein K461DRAFT_263943 [Myriangium duriaei CBS 260.36]
MIDRQRTSPAGISEAQPSLSGDSRHSERDRLSARAKVPRSRSVASDDDETNATIAVRHTETDPAKDDSEAETVLSSPVKRREALRKTNGIKAEPEDSNASIDARIQDPPPSLKPSIEVNHEIPSTSGATQRPKSRQPSKSPSQARPANNVRRRDEQESDGASDLSDLADTNSKAASVSSKRDRYDSEPPNGKDLLNPRKRKHRESSFGRKQLAAETIKRQRRSSANEQIEKNGSGRSSEERSPPAKLRRHKRAASSNQNDEVHEDSIEVHHNGRSRRAASHLPSRDDKTSGPIWDSDSDSEISVQPSQSRNTRSINRSVSTPGRPMGREHKRHVNKYGFTRLAEACESGDLESVKEWLEKDREQLEICEFAGNSPLQIASLNGYPDIVQFLLDRGCNKDCANIDNDTPLIDAVENGHSDVVGVLLNAGVDPLHQNRKGQQALDVITDQTEDGPEIRDMLKKAIEERQQKGINVAPHIDVEVERTDRLGPKQALLFMARTPENLLKLVANNDRKGVIEFLEARVPVDNNIVAAAAKTGDVYLLNLLLADMSPRKAKSKAEKPMLAALGTSHFQVVKALTELEQFDPLWRSRTNGMTWYEYAESRGGPHWKEERELLHRLYTEAQATHRGLSSSPISDFKNSIRRQKSPALSKESDVELDEGDSPDVARIKRRLMSKKDMRAASSRKSPSTESSHAASSPEVVTKPSESDELKPPRRKPGRPRTKSLSSQPTDVKTRRIKATRENIALFDGTQTTGNKSRKPSTSSNSRPAAESVGPYKKVTNNSNEDTIMTDAKAAAEEEERAQTARKEAEEQARREEAEKAAEAQAEIQQRLDERKQKLDTFPSALRHSLQTQDTNPTRFIRYLAHRFLPIQAVQGAALGLEGPDRDKPYMLTYQAAGLLRGRAADELLSLPPQDGAPAPSPSLFTSAPTHPITSDQRTAVRIIIGATRLADQLPSLNPKDNTPGELSYVQRIVHERRLFDDMAPVSWIGVRDFLRVKADLQDAEGYWHLAQLPPVGVAFDAKIEGYTRPSGRFEVLDEELKGRIGKGLKEGDGKDVSFFTGVTKHVTQVTVVAD